MEILVFAMELGRAKISCPTPYHTRGWGMEFRPHPAPPRPPTCGPRYFEPISRRKCESPAYLKRYTCAGLPKRANIHHPAYVKSLTYAGKSLPVVTKCCEVE